MEAALQLDFDMWHACESWAPQHNLLTIVIFFIKKNFGSLQSLNCFLFYW